jgi:hypothetical protein
MSPDLSWRCLELLAAKVLPRVRSRPSLPDDYRVSVPAVADIPETAEPAKGGMR